MGKPPRYPPPQSKCVNLSSSVSQPPSTSGFFTTVNKHVQMSVAAAGATSTLSINMSTLYACFFHLIQNFTHASFHFGSFTFLRTVVVTYTCYAAHLLTYDVDIICGQCGRGPGCSQTHLNMFVAPRKTLMMSGDRQEVSI